MLALALRVLGGDEDEDDEDEQLDDQEDEDELELLLLVDFIWLVPPSLDDFMT